MAEAKRDYRKVSDSIVQAIREAGAMNLDTLANVVGVTKWYTKTVCRRLIMKGLVKESDGNYSSGI